MKNYPYSISEKVQDCIENKRAFVFYRKNKTEEVISLIQDNSELYTTKSFDKPGFVMAPFQREKEAIFFPSSHSKKETFNYPANKVSVKKYKIQSKKSAKKKHIELVKKTIAFIQDEYAKKIVISHKIKMNFDKKQVGLIYEKLLNEYPNALVYVWNHPKIGLWMGATPEKMLSVHGDSYSTMALAGTQLKNDKLDWGEKEKKEQQWVTDFITDQLIPISHDLKISKPCTDYAGHLAHIRTDINGILIDDILLKDLIYKIHPTPAICGVPRSVAREFILKNETYKRDFYTGFLGEINLDKKTELYVNLRCMRLNKTHATLFVGGGITVDSIPEKEWDETLQKSIILARLLS